MKGLNKFKNKELKESFIRIVDARPTNKKDFIEKYLFKRYAYSCCNTTILEYSIKIIYRDINNSCFCTLENIETGNKISFKSSFGSLQTIRKIKNLISDMNEHVFEKEVESLLRRTAYENSINRKTNN